MILQSIERRMCQGTGINQEKFVMEAKGRFFHARGLEETEKLTCVFPPLSSKLLVFTIAPRAAKSFGPC